MTGRPGAAPIWSHSRATSTVANWGRRGTVPGLGVAEESNGLYAINQVERWFAYITADTLQRGDHRSVQALEREIRGWVDDWTEPEAVHLDKDRGGDPRVAGTTSAAD